MNLDEQIEKVKNKILEMGLLNSPRSMVEDEEKHLKHLIELKLNNLDDS
jgi:hypothetical protein